MSDDDRYDEDAGEEWKRPKREPDKGKPEAPRDPGIEKILKKRPSPISSRWPGLTR